MTGAVVEQLTFQDRAKVVSDQVLGRSKTAGYGTPATQPGRPGVRVTRGRCYDHNFLRFFSNFRREKWRFFKKQCYYNFFQKLAVCSLSKKNDNFFAIFWRKYF
jgi:hypothetical protein